MPVTQEPVQEYVTPEAVLDELKYGREIIKKLTGDMEFTEGAPIMPMYLRDKQTGETQIVSLQGVHKMVDDHLIIYPLPMAIQLDKKAVVTDFQDLLNWWQQQFEPTFALQLRPRQSAPGA